MSETQFTFLEVHLGDGPIQFGPKAIGGGSADSAAAGEIDDENADEEDAGGCFCPACSVGCDCVGCKVGKLLIVLGVLAGVAAVAWKLLGDADLDAAEELDELTE